MLRTFSHLLPRSRTWSLTVDRTLRRLFEAFVDPILADVKAHYDGIFGDLFPETTRELPQWEAVFGLRPGTSLSDQDRRDRLASLWSAQGGQSPRYIQDTLQRAGFDLYVHEWWVPGSSPVEARNPFDVIGSVTYGASDPVMESGNPEAEAGNYTAPIGDSYVLVNKLYSSALNYVVEAGNPEAEAGNPEAEAGNNTGLIFTRRQYAPPVNPDFYPYIFYVGGETFGDLGIVDVNRQDELEDLLLKISPQQHWIILIVDYGAPIIEDLTGNDVIDDATGFTLLEG